MELASRFLMAKRPGDLGVSVTYLLVCQLVRRNVEKSGKRSYCSCALPQESSLVSQP